MSLAIGATGEPELPVLSSMTDDIMRDMAFVQSASALSGTYPAANQAYFVPVVFTQPRTYSTAWWLNGATAAGNVDVGLYTLSGTTLTRVAASTAVAQAGVSTMQTTTFPTTTVGPGLYYLAMSCTSASATFWRAPLNTVLLRTSGVFMANTASPLPATATALAASLASAMPVWGLSELSTI